MKTERKLNFIIVILFIAAITLPLVFADFQGGKISTAENRYLATFPKIVENGEFVFRPSAFDNWINDNVGGRSLSTKINTIVNYKLFNLSAKGTDMLGKENWIFYYTQNILDDFTGSNLLSEESLATITDDINIIGKYLAAKDIPLLMVVAPDKKTIYPEYYPDGIKPSEGLRRLQQLEQYVNANSIIPFYSLEKVLIANKSLGYLYSQRVDDAHWNYMGGYVGYEDIISKLNGIGVAVSCVPLSESTITTTEYQSVFNDAVPISEPWYTITNEKSSTVHLNREHMNQFPFLTYNKDSENYKRYYMNDDDSLPSLLFVGDSYSQKLFEFIPQSFSHVMFIHSADLPLLPRILDIESFDIVIIESAERMLDYEFTLLEACAENIEKHVDASALTKMIENTRVCEYTDWGYNYIDYCGFFGTENNTITVSASEATSFMEGWALDPLAETTAGSVVVQVGDQYYNATYGKERTSVVEFFQNEAYLNSGYTINLNTQELIDAGTVIIHVISADGSYQYPPCIYTVHAQ